MFRVIPLSAFDDNYIWAITKSNRSNVIVVDPGEAKPVFQFLEQSQLNLYAILITHKHWDHCGGVTELLQAYPNVAVYTPKIDFVAGATTQCQEGDVIILKELDIRFQILDIPGHTLGHIAYFEASTPMLFCGDTLFTGGCGRIFEGTPEQMYASLKKLMAFPDNTLIYCGHEYTEKNLAFACQLEKNNVILRQRYEETLLKRRQNQPTVPTTLAIEKQTNPFLRCESRELTESLIQQYGKKLSNPVEIFALIRRWKNDF